MIFYYNKTNIKSTILDGGHQIMLANWASYKKIMCSYNNSIPINIPSHLYVLLNRNILCNWHVDAESNFLLESLAACENSEIDLVIYFTVNMAFFNYFNNLVEYLDVPILKILDNPGTIFAHILKFIECSKNAERFCTSV